MSDSGIFPARRTRSQLVLQDDIRQRSPMKHARTTIITQTNMASTSMPSSDGTDELLLSPRKLDRQAGGSKRSVSPELEDEYLHAFDSLSDGRELKRVKREIEQKSGDEMAVDNGLSRHIMQRLAAGHARNNSEYTLAARQFPRKRSATTSNKPSSTVSASPPPSVYSPTASPTKGRAQSVPLFLLTNDMPRIDFKNLPPTPSRSRSPCSPVRQKLRIASGSFPNSSSLPTIHDEPLEGVVIPESPSSVPEENELPRILEPTEAKSIFEEIIRPLMASTCLRTVGFPDAPATPMTQSLNKLIPMSPLTPIFETPCFPRNASDVETEERYDKDTRWGGDLHKEVTASNGPSTSRIPRPMAPPTNIPSIAATSSDKHAPVASAVTKKSPKKNAFDILMKKSFQAKEKVEGKTRLLKGITALKGTSLKSKSIGSFAKQRLPVFAVPQKMEKAAESVDKPKMKMKEKMRPREKPKAHKGPLFIPMPDDDDDEDNEATFTDNRMDSNLESTTSKPFVQKVSEQLEETKIPMQVDERETAMEDDPKMSNVLEKEDILPASVHHEVTGSFPSITNAVPLPLDGSSPATKSLNNEESKPDDASKVKQISSPKPGSGKSSLGKKRQPASIAPVGRVTRSSSKQQDLNIGSSKPVTQKETLPSSSLKRTSSKSIKKSALTESIRDEGALPLGSPMKTSSPVRSPAKSPATIDDGTQTINFGAGRLSLANMPTKSKSSVKPASSPSPSKIARATSMFIKPTLTSVSRTFSVDVTKPTASASGSSLSTLSDALEKLRMPPPSRPNTSMGFNRGPLDDEAEISKPATKDDAYLNRETLGISRPAPGLKRSVTLGSGTFRGAGPSSTKAGTNGKNLAQTFISAKSSTGVRGSAMRGTGRMVVGGGKLPHFGFGGPIRRTVSKKTSLPMVIGSPVKGGGGGDTTMQEFEAEVQDGGIEAVGNDSDVFKAPANASTGSLSLEDLEVDQSSKGKERASSKASNASRRVSMISYALSQSLSTLPQTSDRGLMGPPPIPSSARSTSSSYPASSTSTSESSPSQAGTRSSARIATKISQAKAATDEQNSTGKKGNIAPVASPNPVSESLGILNDCIIFVDVKTDDCDNAGSLFIKMLERIGAKVLTRVGQTCTHIVYKNGLMSTLTRYRLLRDPKPLVVGLGWVVQCVEQRKHVDETNFLVDLEGVNVAGINKRRRSILPKLLAETTDVTANTDEKVDEVEIDSSADVTTPNSDLAPLERARRRKSMLIGPRS